MTAFEKTVRNGLKVLQDVLPRSRYIYLPLLCSFVFWAVRRPREWKERLFSWQVWAEPGRVRVKPDAFIIHFFERYESLIPVYREEIEARRMRDLRRAFRCLYPILGLEDPFLLGLFAGEIETCDFRGIVEEYDSRLDRARSEIDPAPVRSALIRGLGAAAAELASLADALLADYPTRLSIVEAVKKELEESRD